MRLSAAREHFFVGGAYFLFSRFVFWLALPVVHLSKLFETKTHQKGLINKTGVGAALRAAPTPVFAGLDWCVFFRTIWTH